MPPWHGPPHGPPRPVRRLPQGAQSRARGGPFATLNGAAARDVLVVHVPANTTVPGPIHVLYLSSGGSSAPGAAPAAAPRLLAVLEEGSSADIVEEFGAVGGGAASSQAAPAVAYLTNAVAEFELDDRAQLKHSYVQVGRAGEAPVGVWLGQQTGAYGARRGSVCMRAIRIAVRLALQPCSCACLCLCPCSWRARGRPT